MKTELMTTPQQETMLQRQEKAMLDIQISTAKAYPRDPEVAFDKALKIIESQEDIASACFYSMPRAGQRIEGPSVRLAEIIANTWGNIRAASRIIEVGATTVTAQAVVHDLENNVCISQEVSRRITGKNGQRYNEDMITVTQNAACSIALRNAVFKVVPGAVVQSLYGRAREIAFGDTTKTAERRAKCLAYFKKAGLSEEELLAHLERENMDAITKDDLEYLHGVANAIKSGDAHLEDMKITQRKGEKTPNTLAEIAAARSNPTPNAETGELPMEGE